MMFNRSIRTKRRRVPAVTLTETVVGIAVVVVALSVFFPGLAQARRQSKMVRCLANLNRISAASMIYAAGDRSQFAIPQHPRAGEVPGALGQYTWGGKSGVGEPLAGTDRLSSKWGTLEGRGPSTRPLNKILFRDTLPDNQFDPGAFGSNLFDDTQLDLDVYHCPSDFGYAGYHFRAWRNSKLTSFDHYGNSYTASTSWIGVPGQGCQLLSNSSFLKPISRVPNPATTIMYMENCGRFAFRVPPSPRGCQTLSGQPDPEFPTSVRGWHGRMWMFQTAFVDGHAGMIRMERSQEPEPFLGRYPDFGSGNETNHSFWRCVIFRGPGWQLDTLPAPPVQTSIPCASGTFGNPLE